MKHFKSAVSLTILILLLATATDFSQVTQSLRMEYDETQQDEASKIAIDNLGNIFICGSVSDNQGVRLVTTKYDPAGNVVWRKKYRGPAFEDRVAGIELDAQGNCYVGGYSEGTDGVFHYLLIKYAASNGDSLFVKRKIKTGEAHFFCRDSQGNFYLGGDEMNSGMFSYALVKYSPQGDSLWTAYHSGSSIHTIDTDPSGNIYVSGDVFSNTCHTIKYNSSGVQQWANTTTLFMGPSPLGMRLIKCDAQGNTYITGFRYVNSTTREDIMLIKYNAAGSLEWEKRFVNDGRNDYANSLTIDNAGNIIVAGNSYDPALVNYDLLLLKYNPAGDLIWSRFFPKSGPHSMKPAKVLCDAQNNIYAAGGTNQNFVVKYNSIGDTLWSTYTNGSGAGGLNGFADMVLDGSGNIYCAGNVKNLTGGGDMVTIKYTQSTVGIINHNNYAGEFSLSQNYPNPFNPSTIIEYTAPQSGMLKLEVYDYAGKEIETLVNGNMNAGNYAVSWNAAGYASGVYFYKLTAENYSEVRKMILVK
ncbi:MAG: T9SS type A sorting domain-containing protein [Ignavibacteria bacterium]|nr:T9SS type A sorting domain-containing protein [Ignavibacteria bacterium]